MKKILISVIAVVISYSGMEAQQYVFDSLFFNKNIYKIYYNIDFNNTLNMSEDKMKSLKKVPDKIKILGKNYSCFYLLKNDSLFLKDIKFISENKASEEDLRKALFPNNKLFFLSNFSDSLLINTGSYVRRVKEGLHKSLYEKTLVLKIKNGKLLSSTEYSALINDSSKLERTEKGLRIAISNALNRNHLPTNYQCKATTEQMFMFDFEITEEGNISNIHEVYSDCKQISDSLRKRISSLPSFQRMEYIGIPIKEKIKLKIYIDLKTRSAKSQLVFPDFVTPR